MTDKASSGTDSRKYDRLLPCPFCGEDANLERPHEGGIYVRHMCDFVEGAWFETEAEAIDAWNTRAERMCENVMPRSYNYLECSLCGSLAYKGSAEFRYCPNCGAKVVES